MRGYAGSGKSTLAAEIAKENGAVVVNRDLLRLMLLGTYWSGEKADEDRVTVSEEVQVEAFLRAGTNVVVDACHLHPPYLRKWAKLATRLGVEFSVEDVRSPMEACVAADHARGTLGQRSVGAEVIKRQAKRWPMEKWPNIVAKQFDIVPVGNSDPSLLDAYIFDIDGTLAHLNGRSPYDYDKVGTDLCDLDVSELLTIIYDLRKTEDCYPRILIVSGRDDTCKSDTIEWLASYDIGYDDLHMRPTEARDNHGNKIPDWQVKYHIFNEHIRPRFNVRGVFDDRLQVCELWHRLGLTVFRVGDPHANF